MTGTWRPVGVHAAEPLLPGASVRANTSEGRDWPPATHPTSLPSRHPLTALCSQHQRKRHSTLCAGSPEGTLTTTKLSRHC
jgi:hypothetical protein